MSLAARRAPAGFDLWRAVLIGAWATVATLLIWPLASIFAASVLDGKGGFTVANYVQIFTDHVYLRIILNTVLAGIGGMAGALILGLTLAFLTTRLRIHGRALISTLAVIALISPPFIGAYAWIILFGANGSARRLFADIGVDLPTIYGAGGVILVFAFKFFPHVFLITSSALANVNRSVEEAAESLGASPTKRLFTITLPILTPAISTAALLTFVLSIADFGTPRFIGRDFDVLATEAFTLFSAELGGDQGMASAVSLVLIFLSMIVVLMQRYASRRNVFHGNLIARSQPKEISGWKSALAHLIAYAIVFIGALPAIVVAYFSFRETRGPIFRPGFALTSYQRILDRTPDVLWNTMRFSIAALVAIVVAGTLIGALVARRRTAPTALLDGALMIPYVIPGVVMGIAFLATFNGPPLAIGGTGLIIVLAIFIRRLPYSVRATAAALRQVSPSIEEASISLGYSPAQTFLRVTARLILPGILAGGVLGFITAMNELSSSLVLYVGQTMTMPVKIYLSVLDGDYGVASALSTMLLAVTAAAVYVAFRLSGNDSRALV